MFDIGRIIYEKAYNAFNYIYDYIEPFGCTGSQHHAEPGDTGKIEIVGFKGRSIVLDKIPQRIVSLSPSNTEILFALEPVTRLLG